MFGTSTGAIIASLIALGYEVDQIHDLYKEHVPCRSQILDKIEPCTLHYHMMKVNLKKIVEGIECQGDESHSHLKISSGEVVLFRDEAIAAAESDDDLSEHAEWYRESIEQAKEFINHEGDYIPLPSRFDFHEYRVMEEFIRSLSMEAQRDELLSLIKGKGAFAKFKQGLERFLCWMNGTNTEIERWPSWLKAGAGIMALSSNKPKPDKPESKNTQGGCATLIHLTCYRELGRHCRSELARDLTGFSPASWLLRRQGNRWITLVETSPNITDKLKT